MAPELPEMFEPNPLYHVGAGRDPSAFAGGGRYPSVFAGEGGQPSMFAGESILVEPQQAAASPAADYGAAQDCSHHPTFDVQGQNMCYIINLHK